MKWFYSLKKPLRIVIAVCAWLPLVVFAAAISGTIGADGEGMQPWQAVVTLLLLAVGVFFTVFSVIASKREKAAKPSESHTPTHPQPIYTAAPPPVTARVSRPAVRYNTASAFVCKLIKNGNTEMQDNIECCNEGDEVIADYDPDADLYVCSHDVGDIGYFPEKFGNQLTGQYYIKITDIAENENGKYSVEVAVYMQADGGVSLPAFTKVVGVSFDDRQAYIKESREGDPLIIKHTPTSEYPNAAAVVNARTGQMLGHINKDFAASLLSSFGNGFTLEGVIKDITGGTPDAPRLGCNIEITRCK